MNEYFENEDEDLGDDLFDIDKTNSEEIGENED